LPVMVVSIGDLASKWINETTERVADIFKAAQEQAPVVLLLDEIDSVISQPLEQSNNSEDNRGTNTFLTELANLRGEQVLMIGTTNYLDRLDDRAIREGRFDFKIQVPVPDSQARRHLIARIVRECHCTVSDDVMSRLVQRWH